MNRKRTRTPRVMAFLLFLVILLSGCAQQQRCGDGICDSVEREQGACPADCGTQPSPVPSLPKVLYLGLMVHLEGWENEDTNEQQFTKHMEAVQKLAAVFEAHGARATFEVKPEVVRGCRVWGDNVLLQLYRRGHGLGVHADVGGMEKGLTQKEFASRISEMKRDMESLTGVEIRHVSGICSALDWVRAAIDAGFSFTTGTVGYCAMSLPQERRPPQYASCKSPAECHGVIPLALKDRITPWRTNTGDNWLEDDPTGRLVILAASEGLKSLEEERSGNRGRTSGEVTFTEEDINTFMEMLEEALSYAEPGEVAILYVSLSVGSSDIDETLLGKWFDAVQPYVDRGEVEWKTLPQMYDAYMAGKHLLNPALHTHAQPVPERALHHVYILDVARVTELG